MLYDVRCVLCTNFYVVFDIDSHMYIYCVLGMRVLSLFSMVDQLRAPIPTTRILVVPVLTVQRHRYYISYVSEERKTLIFRY